MAKDAIGRLRHQPARNERRAQNRSTDGLEKRTTGKRMGSAHRENVIRRLAVAGWNWPLSLVRVDIHIEN